MINLFNGDCLEVLRTLEDNSIDSIVTDPPYGMDYQSARRSEAERFKKIPNDKKPFVWFLFDAFRVLKDGGALVCFSDWKNQESWRQAIEWAGFSIKSQVIWNREVHGMGDLKGAFAPQHDVIWFATKGKFEFPGKRPKSVINSQRVSAEKLVHPNEKPISLMEELILAVTPPNGAILDPFMGSGTTGKAAINLGFKFVGIEREKEYFEIAKNRIESANDQQ